MGKKTFPCKQFGKIFMTIGDRLREERTRLGMSQPAFAALAGTTKQTLFSWESGRTAPDGFQLAALAAQGVDVLYVLTGKQQDTVGEQPDDERKLLNGFRLCAPEARQNLIQTAALFAAGLAPQTSPSSMPGSMVMSNLGNNNVQVGHSANVRIKKSKP